MGLEPSLSTQILISSIFDVFCATDLTFGPESVFQFGCNVWDPNQWPGYNNDTWYWNFTGLDIYNQGFSTAHEYTISVYYNDQLAWSIDYNSDLIDWISIPPEGHQYFSNVPNDPSQIIGTDPLEEIKIVIGDEWSAGNLSYHLSSRPIWTQEFKNFANNLKQDQGVIYTGNPKVLKKICPGVFGTIKPVGYCMIGKR